MKLEFVQRAADGRMGRQQFRGKFRFRLVEVSQKRCLSKAGGKFLKQPLRRWMTSAEFFVGDHNFILSMSSAIRFS